MCAHLSPGKTQLPCDKTEAQKEGGLPKSAEKTSGGIKMDPETRLTTTSSVQI